MPVPCAKCHAKETGKFPSGSGTAVRLTGISAECSTCHKDPHLGQLSPRCETCHDASSFKVATFKHPKKKETEEFFVAKHATIACAECHKKETADYPAGRGTAVRYAVPVACAHCHEDVHRGALGRDCASCHNAVIWRTASRAFHKTAAFTLEGKHLAVPCASCHLKGVLKGTPDGLLRLPLDPQAGRPLQDGARAATAQTCHRPIAWSAVTWSHAAATSFTLETPHRTLDCESCHKAQVFKGTSRDCYSCHRTDYERVQNPNHVAGGFPTDCTGCHKPSSPTWQGATFTHATFPLAGVHVTQPCAACHKNNVFKGTPRDCFTCHRTDYQNSKNPPHAAAAFPTTCDSCHKFSAPNWKDAGFNHNVTTTFSLAGVHVTQPCTACHVNNVFKGTPRDCYSCHKADYQNSKNPTHAAAGFATTCDTCHKSTDPAWRPASFNHNTATTFAARRRPRDAGLRDLPRQQRVQGHAARLLLLPQDRLPELEGPPHVGRRLPDDLRHVPQVLRPGLEARELQPQHGDDVPARRASTRRRPARPATSTTSSRARRATATPATRPTTRTPTNPSHAAAGFPTTCDTCHQFSDAGLEARHLQPLDVHDVPARRHARDAALQRLPQEQRLQGHAARLLLLPPDRLPELRRTRHTPPRASRRPATPATSSPTPAWKPATFNHTTATTFPLAGMHATQPCTACHKNNVFKGTPRDCFGCHQTDYQNSAEPAPRRRGLPDDVRHLPQVLRPRLEARELQPQHGHDVPARRHARDAALQRPATRTTSSRARPATAGACHQADYQKSANPPHAAAGFPTTCDTCHKFADPAWKPASFNHNTPRRSRSPARTPRSRAPPATRTTSTRARPATASTCHQPDYQKSVNPPHAVVGLPDDVRHVPQVLRRRPGSRRPSITPRPRPSRSSASTRRSPAAACHKNNVYKGTPRDCYSCHATDYQKSVNPPHVAAGFSTTCETCHLFSAPAWVPSIFRH